MGQINFQFCLRAHGGWQMQIERYPKRQRFDVKILARLLAVPLLALSMPLMAEMLVVNGAQITRVYAESRLDSDANLIQLNHAIDRFCHWNRVYVNFDDKKLFSITLAKHLADRPVDIVYEKAAESKTAAMHATSSCRLVSIFRCR